MKTSLNLELKLRNRELFESQLAVELLQHPEYFPSVKKISAAIYLMMVDNKDTLVNVIKTNDKILKELCEPYFGAIFNENEHITEDEIFEILLSKLSNNHTDLKQIMEIHCVFIQRMYDHINNKKDKQALVKILFPENLFNATNRSRNLKNNAVKPTSQLGIATHPVFSKRMQPSQSKHTRAIDKFVPDLKSGFFKSALDKSIPVVCGPSGHTGSLLLGAKLYGDFDKIELMEYTLACFAFLAGGGNHSFHEVYAVAQLLDVPYDAENYSISFTEALIASEVFCKYSEIFPQYLEKSNETIGFNKF